MGELGEVMVPFRWDLVSPDQLGSLLAGTGEPSLWFLESLVACAGKVLARDGDGDLFFVGRSLDSMFDLLSGALTGVTAAPPVHRLPLSFAWPLARPVRSWRRRLSGAECRQARRILAASGLAPQELARRSRPATFADVVHQGSTFAELFTLLRDWIAEDHAQSPTTRSSSPGHLPVTCGWPTLRAQTTAKRPGGRSPKLSHSWPTGAAQTAAPSSPAR